MIVPKNVTPVRGEDTPETGLRVIKRVNLSDTARRIMTYARDLAAGATSTNDIAEILLDYRDDALIELIEYDLRAMLATMTPEHQCGALRRMLCDIQARRIIGWTTVAIGGNNDHLGSIVRYVFDLLGGNPERYPSLSEYQFWDAGIFMVPLPDQGLHSTYNFADFLRLQHDGGMERHENFDDALMLVSETFIWPLRSIQFQAEEQRVSVEQARYDADDTRRLALLERAASNLLLLLSPAEWICSADTCERVIAWRAPDEQDACACPKCGRVYCPEHLAAHVADQQADHTAAF